MVSSIEHQIGKAMVSTRISHISRQQMYQTKWCL